MWEELRNFPYCVCREKKYEPAKSLSFVACKMHASKSFIEQQEIEKVERECWKSALITICDDSHLLTLPLFSLWVLSL